MRGARITVRCDCGQINYMPHGERWQCPGCRRTWNTGQIPAEEYWGIMRDMRALRIKAIGTAVAVVVPVLVVSLAFGLVRLLLLVPVLMAFWFLFYMPRWRRQVRAKARNLQRWTLRPE